MKPTLAELRQEYRQHALHEDHVPDDPFALFRQWFEEALRAEQVEPNAMTLATASPDGRPSARVVLLKGVDARGFVFFTNYTSRKARELEAVAHAALVFWWDRLERQVRIEGTAERVDEVASEAYFKTRPRGSQLGAWASPQSQVIDGAEVLTERLAEVEAHFAEHEAVPRPSHWGGYRVVPHAVEFWQGRPSRLHDRLRYRHDDEAGWILERLAP